MSVADHNNTKQETISKYRLTESDTGSPEVQVALLTKRLDYLTQHAEKNPNDVHSQRGMLRLVSTRKRMLSYLKETNVTRYKNLISSLGLRK